MPPRRPGRGRQVQCHLHFLFSLKSTDANFLLWVRAAVRTDGRSEERTLTGRGRWGDGEARTPRHPAPPPGLRPCLRTVGTAALGWPLSAGAEGTGPPKGSVWSVSEETRQPRPGHGVSYDGIKSPIFFLSVLNVRTHKHLVFKLSSY